MKWLMQVVVKNTDGSGRVIRIAEKQGKTVANIRATSYWGEEP
jgi:hypothetical protein